MFQIEKATKLAAKGRIAILGPAGAGKTFSALTCAEVLKGDGRILFIDSEARSSEKYADIFDFDIIPLAPPYSLDSYIKAIKFAGEQDSYSVIVVDSLSHAWAGEGGALEQVDAAKTKQRGGGGSFTAWREVTPKQWKMVEAILQSPKHIIGCMRTKMEHVMEKDGGKTVVRKVGMAPVQRAGIEYEFDVVIDMDWDHNAVVSKTRMDTIADRVINKPDAEFFQEIADWLSSGEAERPEPVVKMAETKVMEEAPRSVRTFTQQDLLALAEQRYKMPPQQVGEALQAQDITAFDVEKWDDMVAAVDAFGATLVPANEPTGTE